MTCSLRLERLDKVLERAALPVKGKLFADRERSNSLPRNRQLPDCHGANAPQFRPLIYLSIAARLRRTQSSSAATHRRRFASASVRLLHRSPNCRAASRSFQRAPANHRPIHLRNSESEWRPDFLARWSSAVACSAARISLSQRNARKSGSRFKAEIKRRLPAMIPACGPPKSLSPLKQMRSAPCAQSFRRRWFVFG